MRLTNGAVFELDMDWLRRSVESVLTDKSMRSLLGVREYVRHARTDVTAGHAFEAELYKMDCRLNAEIDRQNDIQARHLLAQADALISAIEEYLLESLAHRARAALPDLDCCVVRVENWRPFLRGAVKRMRGGKPYTQVVQELRARHQELRFRVEKLQTEIFQLQGELTQWAGRELQGSVRLYRVQPKQQCQPVSNLEPEVDLVAEMQERRQRQLQTQRPIKVLK